MPRLPPVTTTVLPAKSILIPLRSKTGPHLSTPGTRLVNDQACGSAEFGFRIGAKRKVTSVGLMLILVKG
jgi:hypothetical protein